MKQPSVHPKSELWINPLGENIFEAQTAFAPPLEMVQITEHIQISHQTFHVVQSVGENSGHCLLTC